MSANVLAEGEVLGVLLVERGARIADLAPDLFSDRGYRALFEAARDLLERDATPAEELAVLCRHEVERRGRLRWLEDLKQRWSGERVIRLLIEGVGRPERARWAQNVEWLREHAETRKPKHGGGGAAGLLAPTTALETNLP